MSTPRTIDRDALSAVVGGASRAEQDQRVLDKIQSLVGAVSDVSSQLQQKPNASAAIMPLVAMKAMKDRKI